MVCIYCGSPTQVVNSRKQSRTGGIWRRRRCGNCKAVFSTIERPELSTSIVVSPNGPLEPVEPFIRDKLLLSLHAALGHRSNSVEAASALCDTIIAHLQTQYTSARLSATDIATVAHQALQRFDHTAGTVYAAYHLQRRKATEA